jgi:hypothetical protein
VTNPMKGAEEDSAGTKEGAQSIRISTTRTAPYQSGMMRGHVRDVGLPSESTSASRAVGAGSGSSISSGSLGSKSISKSSAHSPSRSASISSAADMLDYGHGTLGRLIR